jgi:hypothetical protein
MARVVRKMRRWGAWLIGLLAGPFVAAGCGDKDKAQPAGGVQKVGEKTSADKPAVGKPGDLKESADWMVIEDAWTFGTPLAKSGQSTTKQREESDGKFKAAEEAAKRLVAVGLITAAEAGLLAREAGCLRMEIYREPPTGTNGSSLPCYGPVPAWGNTAADVSAGGLAARLPLLEKLAASGKVNPAVAEKVLGTIETKFAVLSDEKELARLENDQKRAEAAKTRDAVKAQMEKVKALVAGRLDDSADWKVVTEAWDFGTPLAKSGQSTMKQRKESDEKFKAAEEAVKRLVAAGLITAAEAELLASEAACFKTEIYRDPPTDSMAKCYDRMEILPVTSSLARVNLRLMLLQNITAGGKVNKAVVEKVLGAMEADLAILSDEKELARLRSDAAKAEALKTRDAVKAQVAKIREMMKER